MQALEGSDGERVYVLMGEGEEIDAETAEQLAASLSSGEILAESSQQTAEEESQQKSLEVSFNAVVLGEVKYNLKVLSMIFTPLHGGLIDLLEYYSVPFLIRRPSRDKEETQFCVVAIYE